MSALVYYVSGHGYGHGVRAAEVMRALRRRRPELAIHLRTSAPAHLFPPVASLGRVELDVGAVQPDALRIDEAATLARAAQLAHDAPRLVESEATFLRQVGAGLVVVDVPPLACLAGRAAGLPVVAVANFSWDWIYAPYVNRRPEYGWLIDWLREAYSKAEVLLRLPYHGDLSVFRRIEDVPLINRPASAARAVLRRRLDLAADDRAVLLSFGGLGLNGMQTAGLAACGGYTFLATDKELAVDELPTNVRLLPTIQENYNDLVAASDAVVTKPGFGIVATCVAEQVPVLYVDRDQFSEYDVLVAGLETDGRARHIPRDELLAGRLGPHLDALLQLPRPERRVRSDGAEVIAGRLLEMMDGAG